MIRVALWMPALLALSAARIYERCELARELASIGARQDHIATWVCIAFHESRFDTAANNPHSGDHGIFQISELYWCGIGKACGLPCSALKNEDIRDDFKCAMQIYEEHTRLQGNGFLAWVVYPHHCKHNAKKYIADCDSQGKHYTPTSSFRSFNSFYDDTYYNNASDTAYKPQPQGVQSLPSYLTVSSIFRENYDKVLELSNKENVDWYNYKVNNIDNLKLPVIGEKTQVEITLSTTTTPVTTTTYIPPVMPWRIIETNQFRRKNPSIEITERSTEKWTTTIKPTTVKPIPSTTAATNVWNKAAAAVWNKASLGNVTNFSLRPTVKTTTFKPFMITSAPLLSKLSTYKFSFSGTSQKPNSIFSSTNKLQTSTSTSKNTASFITPYKFIPFSFTTPTPTTTARTTTRSTKITSTPYKFSYIGINTPSPSTTSKPTASTIKTVTVPYKVIPTIFASRTSSTTAWPNTPTTTIKSYFSINSSPSTQKPLTTKFIPKYSFPSVFTSTKQPYTIKTSTGSPKVQTSTPWSVSKITTTTQSLFDLYLNPTRQPKLFTYNFPTFNSRSKLNIFSDGTTTPSPVKINASGLKSLNRGGS